METEWKDGPFFHRLLKAIESQWDGTEKGTKTRIYNAAVHVMEYKLSPADIFDRKSSEILELLPSQVTRVPWVRIWDETGTRNTATARCGKWLVFIREHNRMDDVWCLLKDATRNGRLGHSTKCATMLRTHFSDPVICAYTYDGDDLEDVRRVKWALEDLGFRKEREDVGLPGWKPDEWTLKGKSGVKYRWDDPRFAH